MARLSPFVPFGLVLTFQAWLWPFWPVFGLSDTLYNLTICEKRSHLYSAIELSTLFTREFAETVLFHRVGRSTLSDQLTISRMFISQTTHSEDSIYKRRNCNLKSKSSFTKVKRIIPEKNYYRNPVQTQETVYCELSRSQRNEVSFTSKSKAKRPTTKNKTKRKKQRKSNSWLRGNRKMIVQTRKDYLLFLEIGRKKLI